MGLIPAPLWEIPHPFRGHVCLHLRFLRESVNQVLNNDETENYLTHCSKFLSLISIFVIERLHDSWRPYRVFCFENGEKKKNIYAWRRSCRVPLLGILTVSEFSMGAQPLPTLSQRIEHPATTNGVADGGTTKNSTMGFVMLKQLISVFRKALSPANDNTSDPG